LTAAFATVSSETMSRLALQPVAIVAAAPNATAVAAQTNLMP
jgi:hypothetical protein